MERALLEKESLKKDMAETEGARRASGVSASGGAAGPPDPEVAEKPKRRRFSAEYRLRIVREADACKEPGEIGALLRREGLYSSLLTAWRRQRDEGALEGLRVDGEHVRIVACLTGAVEMHAEPGRDTE